MVDVKPMTKIDLAEFGMEGEIILSSPSLRKQIMTKNALGNCARTHLVDGKPVVDETCLGGVDIITTLQYVKSAPFKTDLNGFLDYCDRMDANELGSAERLYEKLREMTAIYAECAKSPFAN